MIHKLRRKFIRICTISFLIVFVCITAIQITTGTIRRNRFSDTLADIIADNNGYLPNPDNLSNQQQHANIPHQPFMDAETTFSTRFFVIGVKNNTQLEIINMESVSTVSKDEAFDLAKTALAQNKSRGWIEEYRYKVYSTKDGTTQIVFVHMGVLRSMMVSDVYTTLFVFLVSSLAVMILIVILSRYAIRPAEESYAKQKEFITNVNHELKTPLTLILTNVDIVETEIGQNEWLDDIRSEGQRMNELISRLVILTRMDEQRTGIDFQAFSLSDAAEDTACEFLRLAENAGKTLTYQIDKNIVYTGRESEIRQLIAILLDNAVKYCDTHGAISVSLTTKRHPVLKIENTFQAIDTLAIDRLFDRFYRADSARTSGNSFGIGLSIAKAIAERHHAEILAYNINHQRIRLQVQF